MRVRVYYHISKNVDGSVSVHFHRTMAAAEKAAAADEVFDESTASFAVLDTDDLDIVSPVQEVEDDGLDV